MSALEEGAKDHHPMRAVSTEEETCCICHKKPHPSHSDQVIRIPCQCTTSQNGSILCMDCINSRYLLVPYRRNLLLGKCPRCLVWIKLNKTNGLLHSSHVNNTGDCTSCRQEGKLLLEITKEGNAGKSFGKCDACFLGHLLPLEYECRTCEKTQTIHHPMYRYQTNIDDFGTVLWACKSPSGCRQFSTWRIKKDQIAYIPAGEVPKCWGDHYMRAFLSQKKRNHPLKRFENELDTTFDTVVLTSPASRYGDDMGLAAMVSRSRSMTTDADTDTDFDDDFYQSNSPDRQTPMHSSDNLHIIADCEIVEKLKEGWIENKGSGNDWIASNEWKPRWACLAMTKVAGRKHVIPVLHLYWHETFSTYPSSSISLEFATVKEGIKRTDVHNSYTFDILPFNGQIDSLADFDSSFAATFKERNAWVQSMNLAKETLQRQKKQGKTQHFLSPPRKSTH